MLVEIKRVEDMSTLMYNNLRLFLIFLINDSEDFFENIPAEFEKFSLLNNKSTSMKKRQTRETWLLKQKKIFLSAFPEYKDAEKFVKMALLDIKYDTKENEDTFQFETYQFIYFFENEKKIMRV